MEKAPTSTQRIDWIDALKFIGIFAIAWGHTMPTESYAKALLYAFHVPLFFFLPGLYLSSKKKLNIPKHAKRLLIPYFLIAMLSLAIFMVLGQIAADALASDDVSGDSMRFLPNFLEILCGFCRANRPLWFLPSLFVFNILVYPLLKLVEMFEGRKEGRKEGALCRPVHDPVYCSLQGFDGLFAGREAALEHGYRTVHDRFLFCRVPVASGAAS